MSKQKKILIGIIILAFFVAGYQIARRVVKEQRNTTVEIVADLNDFEELAYNADVTNEEAMAKLKNAGVNSIAVSEITVSELENRGELIAYDGSRLKFLSLPDKFNKLKNQLNENLKKLSLENTSVLFVEKENIYNYLIKELTKRFGDKVIGVTQEDAFAILIGKPLNKYEEVGLGFLEVDLVKAQSLGFSNIVPRVENYEKLTVADIDEIYSMLKKYKIRTIIFNGTQVLGYDSRDKENEKIKYIGKLFATDGKEIVTAILEKPAETDLETVQRGITALTKYSDYKNTKVYSVDTAQLTKLSPQSMADQWGRAISQRNVRILYVRPLNAIYKTAEENFNNTLLAISDITQRVEYMGMKKGIAKGFGEIKQSNFIQLIVAIGTIAGGVLLLNLFIGNKKWLYILIGCASIFSIVIYISPLIYGFLGDLLNKVVAFGAAVIFPSLASIYLIDVYNKYSKKKELSLKSIIINSIKVFLIGILISTIGGVFVGSILSGSEYVLKLDTFRGVKLSFILPIVVFAGAYVLKAGVFTDKDGKPLNLILQTNKFLNTTITVKYGIACGIVLLGVGIVLLRSGNNLVSSVSGIELAMRNFLEKYLVARPRTKELITLPILMLVVILSNYRWKSIAFLAITMSMIGIEDIVNSFCHIRMPVLVTVLSSLYSMIFAIVSGSILIFIIKKIMDNKEKILKIKVKKEI